LPETVNRIARRALDVLKLTFARETLGEPPAEAPRAGRASTFLRRVFAFEQLPLDPVPPSTSAARSVLSWIFRPEPLPRDPEAPRVRKVGVLGAIFFHERLDPPQER
jgi:hypothetical protein